jgi:uncharacterized protein with HEPN domain
MDFDVYRGDLKTKSAVERQLQIITEAAVRLGEDGGPSVSWCGLEGLPRYGERIAAWVPPN